MENELSICQTSKSVVPMIIIAVLVGGLIGFSLSRVVSPSMVTTTPDTGTNSADYQAGFAAAWAKMVEKGIIPDPSVMGMGKVETTNTGGVVKSVSGNTLMVEVPPRDILGDPVVRSVKITADTVIQKLISKTPEVMEVEMEEFMANNSANNTETFVEPPRPFSQEKTTVQAIKVGDVITVTATSVILPEGDITAKTIDISNVTPLSKDMPTVPPVVQ